MGATTGEGRASRASLRLAAVGAIVAGTGVWAFLAPRSFYDVIATYPPYNEHFLHDLGAFIVGLGAAFLALVRWRDGLTVALVANASAAVLHAVAHIMDRDLGGKASDPWLLSAVALLFLVPLIRRVRSRP